MMKRIIACCLVLFLFLPAASAAGQEFESSDWARKDVQRALELPLLNRYTVFPDDFRGPIERGEFAQAAAALVALEFGWDLEGYCMVMGYRGQATGEIDDTLYPIQVAKNLGILKGRGADNWDYDSTITREEAAVMLARTYRAYHAAMPTDLKPLSYFDKGEIADWAIEDVQLMNHLGIMTGNEWNCFQPQSSYTIEQCLVTLLRLHEKSPNDGSKTENPFAIPTWEGGFFKVWPEHSNRAFALETKDYYICAWTYTFGSGLGYSYYYIEVVDQAPKFHALRSTPTAILTGSNSRGDYHAVPENPVISQDGTKLSYTATVNEDVYHTNYWGEPEPPTPLLLKGVYTVTLDLKTMEQTYTRADLPKGN